jgi:hypothetical protein
MSRHVGGVPVSGTDRFRSSSLGHASVDTAARYFRSGSAENAAVIERRVFSD